MEHTIRISSRRVKNDAGLRPFQCDALNAIFKSDAGLVMIEAPVGAGKSYIIRQLTEQISHQPVVLTYPTKILQDAQCNAIREQEQQKGNHVAIWPDDLNTFPTQEPDGLNVLKYSSDSLVSYLLKRPEKFDEFRNRGELLGHGLFDLRYSNRQLFVSTPDVLWLIYSEFSGYKRTAKQDLQSKLAKSVVCFDEFHCYANLGNFYSLLRKLVSHQMAGKVILLSATPFVRAEQWEELESEFRAYGVKIAKVDFGESNEGHVFNFPLNLTVHRFPYRKTHESVERYAAILPKLEKPTAVIFNSLFRLAHLRRQIEEIAGGQFVVREYSGRRKDEDAANRIRDGESIVLLGTSAIEVGVEMRFRSGVLEAGSWTNAIQRLGRIGRAPFNDDPAPENNVFDVHLFIDSRDTWNELRKHHSLSRTELEQILINNLRDPTEKLKTGQLFRGESFSFVLFDKLIGKPIVYSETLFSIYDIDERNVWSFHGGEIQKRDTLQKSGIMDRNEQDRILLLDKLYPIWGIIASDDLRDKYDELTRAPELLLDGNIPVQLQIELESGRTYFFYKPKKRIKISTEMPF